MPDYIGALDQGTTSTRFLIFDRDSRLVASAQREHRQFYPQPGWVEHDPEEIWRRALEVAAAALEQAGLRAGDLAGVGITNQRETIVVWERRTGRPIAPAIVWQDTRVAPEVTRLAREYGADFFLDRTGLPPATYFSALKLCWLLDNTPGAREAAVQGELAAGTIDSFLAWRLTGGPAGGLHLTDITNAGRTQLMNLAAGAWDQDLLDLFRIPRAVLAEIRSSSEIYGEIRVPPLAGAPLAGMLGDQQAALAGQTCFHPGQAKNTYGTGCFLLLNTGEQPARSRHGLLSTPAYKFGAGGVNYALEGSIAVAGALVQWFRDNLGFINTSAEIEALAATVEDNGGVYFVPAFSGLFAPYWNERARGVVAGLTRFATKGHLARAALEATAFQTRDVVEAMEQDSGAKLEVLRVDGGMVANDLLMQFQADILGRPVVRPAISETTALGAAYAAGLATGFYKNLEDLKAHWSANRVWEPRMAEDRRQSLYSQWKKAVARAMDWV